MEKGISSQDWFAIILGIFISMLWDVRLRVIKTTESILPLGGGRRANPEARKTKMCNIFLVIRHKTKTIKGLNHLFLFHGITTLKSKTQ